MRFISLCRSSSSYYYYHYYYYYAALCFYYEILLCNFRCGRSYYWLLHDGVSKFLTHWRRPPSPPLS